MEGNTTLAFDLSFSSDESNTTSVFNLNFKVRNISIGSLGALANIIAFLIVLRSKKLKYDRKLLLQNLIVSDFALLFGMLMLSMDTLFQILSGNGCLFMIFNINMSMYISYIMCLLLSIVNFLAVYKPFSFARIVTFKRTGIVVVFCWLMAATCNYWWVNFNSSPGSVCAPLAIVSEVGLLGFSTVLLAILILVFGLNAAIVIKLKGKSRPGRVQLNHLEGGQRQNSGAQTENPSNNADIVFSNALHVSVQSGSINKTESLDEKVITNKSLPKQEAVVSRVYNLKEALMSENVQVEIQMASIDPNRSHIPDIATTSIESNDSRIHDFSVKSKNVIVPEHDPTTVRNPVQLQTQVIRTRASIAEERLCKVLILLISFSCLITLPVPLYLVCIATKVIKTPEEIVHTDLGIFVSSCPAIKACINPFLYVLYFVNWRKSCKYLLFCRDTQPN